MKQYIIIPFVIFVSDVDCRSKSPERILGQDPDPTRLDKFPLYKNSMQIFEVISLLNANFHT